MHKIKLTISYDGSKFNGFQIQNNNRKITTVAGHITKHLKKINIDTKLVGSGRTDSGVHATAQVIHCDIPAFWSDLDKLKLKLNQMLDESVHVKKIERANDEFHARYSAKKRLYRYILYTGQYQPFYAPYALHVESLDTHKLNEILKQFIGIYDFKYFKKPGSITKTDTREIFKAGAYTHKDFTIIYFLGNSFLRSQIRMMSDFALKTMEDEFDILQLKEQLNIKKIHSTNIVPASGLYLSKIFY